MRLTDQETKTNKGWHVAQWGFWGWLETAVKGVGILAGILAFLDTRFVTSLTLANHPHLAGMFLLALLSAYTVFVLSLRIPAREIISIIFASANVLGHVGMFIALMRIPNLSGYPVILGLAFIFGEMIKQRFLAISRYNELGLTTDYMISFSRGVAIVYALFVLLFVV